MNKNLFICIVLGILLVGTFIFVDFDKSKDFEYEFNNSIYFYGPVPEAYNQNCFHQTGKMKLLNEVCE